MRLRTAHERGLPHVAQRHNQAERCGSGVGQGNHARDVAQGAVEPQLAAEGEALCTGRAQLAGGHEKPDGDREVEAGAALAHTGRRQIHRDSAQRPGQAARQDGGADPVARLSHSGVRQSDNCEAWETVGDVDLDRDGAPDRATQRDGRDRSEHAK